MTNIIAFLKMKDMYLLGPVAASTTEGDMKWRRWNPTEIAREKEITDLVEGRAGGSIRIEFTEENRPGYAYIVEVPEENKDVLLESPNVSVIYTGRIPRSTASGDPQFKLATRIWDTLREGYVSKL